MDDFPVMMTQIEWAAHPSCPKHVPWALLEPHQSQAIINHKQMLERLASWGGLHPDEIVALLENRPFRYMPTLDAVSRLLELVGPDVLPPVGGDYAVP